MKPCSKCGDCCKRMKINYSERLLPHDKEFYLARGFDVYDKQIVIDPCICPHLTKDNLCDIYDNRPFVCRMFVCKKRRKKR